MNPRDDGANEPEGGRRVVSSGQPPQGYWDLHEAYPSEPPQQPNHRASPSSASQPSGGASHRSKSKRFSKSHQESISKLPFEALTQLSPEILESLPPETLARLPVEKLSGLSVSTLVNLPVELLAKLPAQDLARLPPTTLAKLPSSTPPKIVETPPRGSDTAPAASTASRTGFLSRKDADKTRSQKFKFKGTLNSANKEPASPPNQAREETALASTPPNLPPRPPPHGSPLSTLLSPSWGFSGATLDAQNSTTRSSEPQHRVSDEGQRPSRSGPGTGITALAAFLQPMETPSASAPSQARISRKRSSLMTSNHQQADNILSQKIPISEDRNHDSSSQPHDPSQVENLKLKTENETLERQVMKLTEKISRRERDLYHVTADMDDRMNGLKAAEKELERTKDEMAQLKKKTTTYEQQMNEMQGILESKDHQLREVQQKQDRNISDLERMLALKDRQLQEGQKKQDHNTNQFENMLALKDRQLQEVRQKQDHNTNELENMLVSMDRQLQEVQQKQKREIDELKDILASKEGELREFQQKQMREIDELHHRIAAEKSRHAEILSAEKENYEDSLKKLNSKLRNQRDHFEDREQSLKAELRNQNAAFKRETQAMIDNYENMIQEQAQHYGANLRALDEKHKEELRKHKDLLQQEKDEHRRSIASLRSNPGDQIRPASDNELKTLFQRLRLLVEVVTEPFNLGVVVMPPDTSRLDPSQFLQREGKNMVRYLLRSIVWSRIVDGFFSAPFGFGAFGSGEGKTRLAKLFFSWRGLFSGDDDDSQPGTSLADQDFGLFRHDKIANLWRSSTFHSILASVVLQDGNEVTSDETAQALIIPYRANQAKVAMEILEILKDVTNSKPMDGIEDKTSEICRLAGELALHAGIHKAHLGLFLPGSGEAVQIGDEFVDCEDGDAARGGLGEVDIAICPYLFKVGDGRSDFSTMKPIVRGEIYASRSS